MIELLERKFAQYNTPSFMEGDPVSVPHSFSRSENIEIAGLLTATIAWGQRATIIRNALEMIGRGQIRADRLITHRLPLEEIHRGMELLKSRQALKVLLKP